MPLGLFPEEDENSHYLSRSVPDELLGTFSDHPFELEDKSWPTVEHYFQASQFENQQYSEKVRQADSADAARKLGNARFRRRRKDWKQIRTTIMTRGLYIKCRTYPEVAQALLDTNDQRLVENSNYDYFWGCGRDRRGENHYGQVLMNVRDKLREEAEQSTN